MKEFAWRLAVAMTLSLGIAAAIAVCVSCGPSRVEAVAATYQAEQLACVDKFKPDNDKVTECRNQVKARYGRYDGGTDGN